MPEEIKNSENLQPQEQKGMELATEEEKNELKRGLIDVSTRNNALNSMKIINKRKLLENKNELVKELLAEMEKAGVDLRNLDSINEFLNNLEQQNPDLRQLFEIAFDQLSQGGENNQATEEINNVNNIKTNDQGISQGV
jgi:hypothetical protein